MWKFFWYPDGTDDPLANWFEGQDDRVRATHARVIDFLNVRLRHEWKMPQVDKIAGSKDLYEIRIKANVQHRLLGFFGTEAFEFIVVIACIHKGKQYKPHSALDTAEFRLKEIRDGKKTPLKCRPPRGSSSVSKQRLS
jgi:phage-related protein